jgi:uncharacterized DUF497 family protein
VFDWDDANVGHIAEHGADPDEAEQALVDLHRRSAVAYDTATERRWAVIGATEARRILFVVYTRRSSAIRVVTARDALDRERCRYRR